MKNKNMGQFSPLVEPLKLDVEIYFHVNFYCRSQFDFSKVFVTHLPFAAKLKSKGKQRKAPVSFALLQMHPHTFVFGLLFKFQFLDFKSHSFF